MSTPEGDRPRFGTDPAAGSGGDGMSGYGPIPPVPNVPGQGFPVGDYGPEGHPTEAYPAQSYPAEGAAAPGVPSQGAPGVPDDDMPRRPTQRRMVRRSPEEPPPERVDHGNEVGSPSAWLREIPVLVAVALGIALLVKTFLVQAFFIPSESMENTLLVGDRVLVNKFAARFGGDVQRGQVIVFKDPGGWLDAGQDDTSGNSIVKSLKDVFSFVGLLPSSSEKDLIKRVIGVPGDKVACCDAQGRITVNGVPLDEPYLYAGDKPSDRAFSVTVPPNRLWVMGDHRSDSADSRSHMDGPGNGTIPAGNVVGRAFVLVWPFDRWKALTTPATFKRSEIDDAPLGNQASAVGLSAMGVVWLRRRRERARLTEGADLAPANAAAAGRSED